MTSGLIATCAVNKWLMTCVINSEREKNKTKIEGKATHRNRMYYATESIESVYTLSVTVTTPAIVLQRLLG